MKNIKNINHKENTFIKEVQKGIFNEYNWNINVKHHKQINVDKFEKYEGIYYETNNNIKCEIKLTKQYVLMIINKYKLPLLHIDNHFIQPEFEMIAEFTNNKLILYQKNFKLIFNKNIK